MKTTAEHSSETGRPTPAAPVSDLSFAPALKSGSELLRTPFPADYTAGARNAVTTCLRIEPSEKVTLITDEGTVEIAASIARELAGARLHLELLHSGEPGATPAFCDAAGCSGGHGVFAGFDLRCDRSAE